jgi:hypothetical protein
MARLPTSGARDEAAEVLTQVRAAWRVLYAHRDI